ncbi:hypothetical protein ACU4HD_05450 [Cupriavidus basilensis]
MTDAVAAQPQPAPPGLAGHSRAQDGAGQGMQMALGSHWRQKLRRRQFAEQRVHQAHAVHARHREIGDQDVEGSSLRNAHACGPSLASRTCVTPHLCRRRFIAARWRCWPSAGSTRRLERTAWRVASIISGTWCDKGL